MSDPIENMPQKKETAKYDDMLGEKKTFCL